MEYSDYLFTLLFNEYYLKSTEEPYDLAYPLMLELNDKYLKSIHVHDETVSEYDAMCNFLEGAIKECYVKGESDV